MYNQHNVLNIWGKVNVFILFWKMKCNSFYDSLHTISKHPHFYQR